MNNRRDFLKKAAMGGAVLGMSSSIVSAMDMAEIFHMPEASKIELNKGDVVLFQGDSITDSGRQKDAKMPNNNGMLGNGYSLLAGAHLLYQYSKLELKIYNKGISGNKVFELAKRWDADCLDLKPNVLSILIGVNDFWHTKTNDYKGTVKTYEDDFRALLERTLKSLPNVKLIIGEPFAVKGIRAVDDTWYPAFDAYRNAAKKIATEFNAIFIPYQSIFDKAITSTPGSYWTHDGVHPSLAGAQLMANAWLESFK